MPAKTTAKNQIALPKEMTRADEVRVRIAELDIEAKDVETAVSWARETKIMVGTEP
jgi:hypothetical protein